MVKLTPELINQAYQYMNPVRDREIDLRGYKIPVIENLGATLDQFDTIDFSDNDIRKLDGFPLLKRIKCLLMNNNRIIRIADDLSECLPSLDTLILTNNGLMELGDLEPLANIKSIRTLSLMHNPVTTKEHYRLFVVYKMPFLRIFDFKKITDKEREAAKSLFKSKQGKALQKEIKAKTFIPGHPAIPTPSGPTADQVRAIKEAISKASSLEEIERLNQMLKAGHIPGKSKEPVAQVAQAMEEDEEWASSMTPANGH